MIPYTKSIAVIGWMIAMVFTACSKKDAGNDEVTPVSPASCKITSVVQQNNGSGKPDFAITIGYDAAKQPVSLVVYDSAAGKALVQSTFTYVKDTIRFEAGQYFLTDAGQRIRFFHTRADVADAGSDVYDYEYLYDDSGYLVTKNLYINSATQPDYVTTYTYKNSVLTGCRMVVTGAGNAVLLSASLNYNYDQAVQNWLYHFPDGFESYLYESCFNFGKKSAYALKSAVTQLFDVSKNAVADQWITNYGNYRFSAEGNVTQATATGDEQQGFALFYGKTAFAYSCK